MFPKNTLQILTYIVSIISIIWIADKIIRPLITDTATEHFGGCENQMPSVNDMPESASEACKRISSKRDEILAHYGGVANVMKNFPFASLANPNNYTAGDNTTDSMTRNIINVNLSSCEVQKIYNTCRNAVSSAQSNIIDNTMCKFCNEKGGCDVENVQQLNDSIVEQTCSIQLLIKALSEKKNSVDAQALASVLQTVDGLMSGDNTVSVENCNIIEQDLSSNLYLESKNECLNTIESIQENQIKVCGKASGISQKNSSQLIQNCIQGTSVDTITLAEADTKTKAELAVEQENIGITSTAIIASIIACVVCMSSSAAAGLLFMSIDAN